MITRLILVGVTFVVLLTASYNGTTVHSGSVNAEIQQIDATHEELQFITETRAIFRVLMNGFGRSTDVPDDPASWTLYDQAQAASVTYLWQSLHEYVMEMDDPPASLDRDFEEFELAMRLLSEAAPICQEFYLGRTLDALTECFDDVDQAMNFTVPMVMRFDILEESA